MLGIKDKLDIGFVILSPEPNVGRLLSTVRSINKHYGEETPRICVVAKKTPPTVLTELKTVCPAVRGRDTITSLINIGMRKGHKEWNVVVMEGVWVRPRLNFKYANFLESSKDVFFPIVPDYDREGIPIRLNNTFVEATLNGLCIHQATHKEVGDFGDEENIEFAKMMWAITAQEKGCKFKAVLGAKIC